MHEFSVRPAADNIAMRIVVADNEGIAAVAYDLNAADPLRRPPHHLCVMCAISAGGACVSTIGIVCLLSGPGGDGV